MKKPKLPATDSIQALAEFWDTHDVTAFEHELEPVPGPVFKRPARAAAISVKLDRREAEQVEQMAQLKGVSPEQLIRSWVQQKITRQNSSRTAHP